jgi:3-hydroxyacyl-[acyl-carrier-protein] dehydratase
LPESVCRQFRIDANHPCFEGHFPDDPIVPGVILLDRVRLTAAEWKPDTRIKSITTAKFHHPLYPDQLFTVTLTEAGIWSLRFVCYRGVQKLASGSLTLENRD